MSAVKFPLMLRKIVIAFLASYPILLPSTQCVLKKPLYQLITISIVQQLALDKRGTWNIASMLLGNVCAGQDLHRVAWPHEMAAHFMVVMHGFTVIIVRVHHSLTRDRFLCHPHKI